jgi:DNA-binding transcriptional MerR regulator
MPRTIGEVARETGFPASTLRYYEAVGLLPAPRRVGGRRRYEDSDLDRLRVIALARSLDFPLNEIRDLLDGFPAATPASERWRATNRARIAALEAQAARIQRMLGLLRHLSEDCNCPDLAQCARAWTDHRDQPSAPAKRARQRKGRATSR